MRHAKFAAAAMLAAFALGACTGGVERNMDKVGQLFDASLSAEVGKARTLPPGGRGWKEVREAPAVGRDFNAYLVRDYKSLMLFEADEMYDDISANIYAGRALEAVRGRRVEPVRPEDFILTPDHLAALQSARGDMTALFAQGAPQKFPERAARVQTSYDCWVEQQEENHQPDHIAACRDDFVAELRYLREDMTPAPAPTEAAAPAAPPAPPPQESYTVLFAHNAAVLDPTARATLDLVIQALKTQNAGASIIGYADTTGTDAYNLALSQRRAKAIADALLGAGIRPAVVTTEGRGEKELAAPTKDNVREPRNRRATINIR